MDQDIDEEALHFVDRQVIELDEFKHEGLILDIGGGGEGVIGQLFKEKVIAIDIKSEELEEAPEGPLKLVMDAAELKFLDYQFKTVTSFFTMMYLDSETKEKAVREIYRVLKPGGRFLLWDATIPPYREDKGEVYVLPLEIKFKNKVIDTGYGVPWQEREQDIKLYTDLTEKVGFKVVDRKIDGQVYYLELKK